VGNVIADYDGSPTQTHGIAESGSSDHNKFLDNFIVGVNGGANLITVIGANTIVRNVGDAGLGFARGTGSGAVPVNAIPTNDLDLDGGLTIRTRNLTLANTGNDNVALPAKAGVLYVTGPSAGFDVTGFAGGVNGRKVTLINTVGFTMTLKHNVTSTAGNRFLIGGAADLAITQFGAVELTYTSAMSGAWVVTGYKG
jgi:hypothetical protein